MKTYHLSQDSSMKKEILEFGRNVLCRRVAEDWNRCPERGVISPSSEIFKTLLDGGLEQPDLILKLVIP